jgi:hypothetical protein
MKSAIVGFPKMQAVKPKALAAEGVTSRAPRVNLRGELVGIVTAQ